MLWGSCVFRLHLCVAASNIAHSDRIPVVSAAMCAYVCLWASGVHTAVKPYEVVVPDSVVTLLAVPAVDLSDAHLTALWSCRAVNDDFVDFSHGVCVFHVCD